MLALPQSTLAYPQPIEATLLPIGYAIQNHYRRQQDESHGIFSEQAVFCNEIGTEGFNGRKSPKLILFLLHSLFLYR